MFLKVSRNENDFYLVPLQEVRWIHVEKFEEIEGGLKEEYFIYLKEISKYSSAPVLKGLKIEEVQELSGFFK